MRPPHRHVLLLVATVAYTALTFIWFSFPAYLGPIIEEVGLSSTQAGIIVGAVPLTYIPFAMPSGVTIDRIGAASAIGLGALCFGIGQIGRSFASTFPSLLAWTILIGIGATTITFGLPKLVAQLYSAGESGFPTSVYLIGAATGSAAAFAIGRPIIGPAIGGWRPLFLGSGVVAVSYALLWLTIASKADLDVATRRSTTFDIDSISGDLAVVLRHRELRLIVVIGTMYLTVTHGIQGWLPTMLEFAGRTAALAGQLTSLYVVAAATGTLFVPMLADRYNARRFALICCGSACATGIGLLLLADATVFLAGVIFLAGLGTGGISPLIRAIPPEFEELGPRLTGTAIAFVFMIGEIGGAFGPIVIGMVHQRTGSFAFGFGMLATAGIIVVLAALALETVE